MKNKLLCANLELQSMKMEASEEMMKCKQNIMHLLGLLKIAYQERDEARDQLYRLLDKLASPLDSSFNDLLHGPAYSLGPQHDIYPVPAKANSSVTESDNSQSPVESFYDVVSSPDSSSLMLANQQSNSFIQEYGVGSLLGQQIDPGTAMIDELAMGKVLPQKGKLLEAVMEAGPLLQTLLVAGPLPQWRDPPPLQPISVPPMVSVKGCDPPSTGQRPVLSPTGIIAQKALSLGPYNGMPRANPQMCSASMLSLMGLSGLPCNSGHFLSSSPSNRTPMVKRQRFQ